MQIDRHYARMGCQSQKRKISRRVGKDKRANTNGKMDGHTGSDFCDFVVVQLVKFRKKFLKFRLRPKTKEILTPRNRRMRIPREKGASFSPGLSLKIQSRGSLCELYFLHLFGSSSDTAHNEDSQCVAQK